MTELFIDVSPIEGGPPGAYRVNLVGYRAGASPRIERITDGDLLQRLETVLQWPHPTIERLRHELRTENRLKRERLESVTTDQLRELGFDLPD
jgi:hypothetical protein